MQFIPKMPLAMLQLRTLTIMACDIASRVDAAGGSGGRLATWLSQASTYWPWITAVYISAALIETLCRQWIWFRCDFIYFIKTEDFSSISREKTKFCNRK